MTIRCPRCGCTRAVSVALATGRVQCAECGGVTTIPRRLKKAQAVLAEMRTVPVLSRPWRGPLPAATAARAFAYRPSAHEVLAAVLLMLAGVFALVALGTPPPGAAADQGVHPVRMASMR